MTHPLEDENRRLRAALEECVQELDDMVNRDYGPLKRARAALAAEPASGEARSVHYTRDDQDRIVIDGLTFGHYDAPPSPPTQGEEAKPDCLRDHDPQDACIWPRCVSLDPYKAAIETALRQRAAEAATEVRLAVSARDYANDMLDKARESLAEARRPENEACAKMSDKAASNARFLGYEDAADEFENLSAAIRARITP